MITKENITFRLEPDGLGKKLEAGILISTTHRFPVEPTKEHLKEVKGNIRRALLDHIYREIAEELSEMQGLIAEIPFSAWEHRNALSGKVRKLLNKLP